MTLTDALRDEYETELSRLGSSKVLYALTDGEMEADAVTAIVAGRASARAETLSAWADEGDAAETFASAAETERSYADGLAEADPLVSPVDETLRSLEGDAERLGGLLAATIVEKRITDQVTGFFVGQADPRTAGDVRDHSGALEERIETLESLLADVDEDAPAAGERVIEAAYEEYVDRLEAQGVNPKPVC